MSQHFGRGHFGLHVFFISSSTPSVDGLAVPRRSLWQLPKTGLQGTRTPTAPHRVCSWRLGFVDETNSPVAKVGNTFQRCWTDLSEAEARSPTQPTRAVDQLELALKKFQGTSVFQERKRRAENIFLVFGRGGRLVGEHLLEDDDIRQDLVLKWKKKKLNEELDDLLSAEEATLHTQLYSHDGCPPRTPPSAVDGVHLSEREELGDPNSGRDNNAGCDERVHGFVSEHTGKSSGSGSEFFVRPTTRM